MSDLQAIVSALLSADIRPIVCTPPPVPTTPVETPTRRRRWDQLNAWIKGWCPANRIQMVDVASKLRGDKDPIHWAHLLSNSRIRYGRNAGVSGNTLAQMRARVQSDIIAPGDVDVCVVMGGTNDSGGGVAVSSR